MKFAPPNPSQLLPKSLPSFKRIFVPLDFSACASNALSQALVLALRTGAEVVIFHAVHIPMMTSDKIPPSILEMENEAKAELSLWAEEIRTWLAANALEPLNVSTMFKTGFPAEEIIAGAKSSHADLIVMGTQGAGRVEAFLLGSNASTVIASASCPVFAIPENHLLYQLDKLVFGTDLEVIDPHALGLAAQLAGVLDADLELLHIFSPGEAIAPEQLSAFEAKVKEVINYQRITFNTFETFHDNISQSLEQYITDYNIKALALLKRERGFFAGLFHTSVTKRLAIKAHIPLLMLSE